MSSNLAFFLCISLLFLIVPSSHAEFSLLETQNPITEEIVSTPSEALPQELPIVTPTVVTPTPVPHINPRKSPPTETPVIGTPSAEQPATDGNEIPPPSSDRGMPPAVEKETPLVIEKETPQTAEKETNPAPEQEAVEKETPPLAVEKETPPLVIEKGTPRVERHSPTERRPVNEKTPPRSRQEKQERLNERLNERERILEQEKEKEKEREREKQEIHERVARERMEREKREQEQLEEEKNKRRAQMGSTAPPTPVKKQRDNFKMEAKHAEKEQPLEENEEILEHGENEWSGHASEQQERGYEEGIPDSLHEDTHSHHEADNEQQVYINKETRQEEANLNQNSETLEQGDNNAGEETTTVQDEVIRRNVMMDPEIPVDFSKKIEKKPKKMKETKDTVSKETQNPRDIFNEWYLKPAYEVIARLEKVVLDIYPKYQQCKENTLCFSAVSMIFFLVTLIKFTQWFNYLFRRRKPSGNNQVN